MIRGLITGGLAATYVMAVFVAWAQVTPEQLAHPFEVTPEHPLRSSAPTPAGRPACRPPPQVPANLKDWPCSCQQVHYLTAICEAGRRDCDQRALERWRKRCQKDEPHDQ